MKINGIKNIWLTGIYMLFLLLVFALFAFIQNNSGNNAIPVAVYVLLFVIIIPASLLYYWAFKQNAIQPADSIQTANDQQAVSEQNEQVEKAEVGDVLEEFIDIKKLLPKEKADTEKFGEEVLQNLAAELQISQGLFYVKDMTDDTYKCFAQYAYYADRAPVSFKLGETLPGQAVKNKNIVTLSDIPEKYMTIASGLGESSPCYLTFVPLMAREEVIGLIEFASFKPTSSAVLKALKQLADRMGETLTKMIKK
jgi:hypothetical protein